MAAQLRKNMKFFIPAAASEVEAEGVYGAVKAHLAQERGANVSPRRIRSLQYVHNGKNYSAVVGEEESGGLGIVVTILFDVTRSLYLVCTPHRGVIRGSPILVGEHDVRAVTDFEN
jgi:hypothetical protein